jgi:O-methyltransferase involved in polyketide biosynthesis
MANTLIENVSYTAFWIARTTRAVESARPDAIFHDPLAALLAGEQENRADYAYVVHDGVGCCHRHAHHRRLHSTAIAEGIDTVVNLGAGLEHSDQSLEQRSSFRTESSQ